MANCLSCGTQNLEEAKFCLECGYSFMGVTGQLVADIVMEGRYIITRTLGRGGMGAVYLASDQRLNNIPVAIKEMSTNAVGKGSLQAAIGAFKQEATMLISLRHPALPRITDFFSQGEDRWYLVMDYIEGENLKAIAEQRGPIPEAEVQDWAKQLCEILEYLHTQKPPVIFRDLKPTNIMLTPQGQIKLIDFGIARHFRSGQTSDTTAYGSHGFSPPEQFGQNQTDARSDIYALGATIHFLLTGVDSDKHPFIFEPPSKHVKISPEFEATIMKTLEFKAQNRLGSAGELLILLQKHIEQGESVHKTIPIKESPAKSYSKQINQWLAGILAVVILIFGLSAFGSGDAVEAPLNAPQIIRPVNGANLAKGNINAQWTSVPGAVEYEYAIRNLTSDSIIIPTTKTSQTGFTITSAVLTSGHQYKVWVAAVDEKGKVCGTTKVFKVKNDLPALKTPEEGSTIYHNDLRVMWKKVMEAVKYDSYVKSLTNGL